LNEQHDGFVEGIIYTLDLEDASSVDSSSYLSALDRGRNLTGGKVEVKTALTIQHDG
jgi:hypothetical protein